MIPLLWSSDLAYVVGLITTDGSLSKDGRHIDVTSKDLEQLENVKRCLALTNTIGQKRSGAGHISWRIQIGNVKFYNFLLSVGLTPAKTKTLKKIEVPKEYFFDFLRGHFDGDGSFYVYMDKRWKSSCMFYLSFVSASQEHICWLREQILELAGVHGYLFKQDKKRTYQLKFAKAATRIFVSKMYPGDAIHLSRKFEKIKSVVI